MECRSSSDTAEQIGELFLGHCSKLSTRRSLGFTLKSLTITHRRHRALEIAAGVGERCRVGDSTEGASDVALAGGESEPIRYKARNRNSVSTTMRVRTENEASIRTSPSNGSDISIERMQRIRLASVGQAHEKSRGNDVVRKWLIFIAIYTACFGHPAPSTWIS